MAERGSLAGLVNDRLERRLGLRVVKIRPVKKRRLKVRPPAGPADRLLPDPVFLLSSVRSGSTLLRVVLDSHSAVHAPHETHFRRLLVNISVPPARQAMEGLRLNDLDLEHLLWDRLLHRELVASGKRVLVEKTPSNVFVADRLATAWPEARFVFLLRHPASIARSWHEGDPQNRPMDLAVPHTLNFMEALEAARSRHDGLTVRYEDVVTEPEKQVRVLCEFLGLEYEPAMLAYGEQDHGDFVKGVGDWRDKIRSGRIQACRPIPAPADVPADLRPMCERWGY